MQDPADGGVTKPTAGWLGAFQASATRLQNESGRYIRMIKWARLDLFHLPGNQF